MAEYQTTVQDTGAILRGSGKLEVAVVAASPSWVNVGAITGLKLEEAMEVNAEENDNTDSEERVTKQTATLSCTMMEPLRDPVRTILRGDLDTRTANAGAEVAGATYTLASGSWAVQTPYELPGQNATGAAQTISSIVGGTDGALTAGEDYEQVKLPSGNWGILMMTVAESSALTTTAQALVVTYTYTPAASVDWQTGNKSSLPKFMARITTLNDSKTFITTLYYGQIKKGLSIEWSKDDDADRRVGMPLEVIFKVLPTGQGYSANVGLLYNMNQTDGF